jgi:hypothetical protein
MTSIPSSQILLCLKPLRRDGIFVKNIEYYEVKGIEFGLTLANYITDIDNGHDVECLYEKGDIEDNSCYCQAITCGSETSDDKCLPCPFCHVPTKRHSVKERLYTVRLSATLEDGVKVINKETVPSEMLSSVMINLFNTISEIKTLLPRLDLSGGPCPSYGSSYGSSFSVSDHED